jgi:hypothetical protein
MIVFMLPQYHAGRIGANAFTAFLGSSTAALVLQNRKFDLCTVYVHLILCSQVKRRYPHLCIPLSLLMSNIYVNVCGSFTQASAPPSPQTS